MLRLTTVQPMKSAMTVLGIGVLLLLTACAAQTTSSLMHDIQVKSGTNVIVSSASGMPPGVYPGRKQDVHANQRQNYDAYLQVSQPWIAVLNQRQDAIARGSINSGCIGADVMVCIATLSKTLAIATSFQNLFINPVNGSVDILAGVQDPFLQQVKKAVDGKLIFERTLRFYAYIPGQSEGILPSGIAITVDLDSDWRIHRVSAVLLHDPIAAHTEQEYDKTGIFELLTATGVQPCNLVRLELYRTFEAQLKPTLTPSHNVEVDMSSASETYGKHGKLDVCGRSVWYISSYGVSTDLITPNDLSGRFGGGSLQIE